MVNKIGQGLNGYVGIGYKDIDIAQLLQFCRQPFGRDTIGGGHIRHTTDHLTIAIVDAQETGACA